MPSGCVLQAARSNDYTDCLPFHGQTDRFTVWANGKRNSGLVNFIPESRLSFVQIISTTKKRSKKRPRSLKLLSKTALKKWNTNFRLEHSVRKKYVPLLPEIFRWNDPKSSVPFTFQPGFPETFCECGKRPQCTF